MVNEIILLIKTFIIDIFFNIYLLSTCAVPDTFWQQ